MAAHDSASGTSFSSIDRRRSASPTLHHDLDLEKADTIKDQEATATTIDRVSRIQSLTRRSTRGAGWTHPLSHVKTTNEVLVDFDGKDDPYRPLNWPLRKKITTTLLYGFTTMGSTWASSVYVFCSSYEIDTFTKTMALAILRPSSRLLINSKSVPRFRF